MRYEYYFVGLGEVRKEYTEINNEIWFDVGNTLKEGSFDHHSVSGQYDSTVDILVKRMDLLDETIKQLNTDDVIRIYFHIKPDLDAIGSFYCFRDYLEKGKEFFEDKYIKSAAGQKLIQYFIDIDSGLNKIVTTSTLYFMHVSLYCEEIRNLWKKEDNNGLYTQIIDTTLSWIDKAYKKLQTDNGFDIYRDPLPIEACDELSIIQGRIDPYELYKQDKADNRLIIANTSVWAKRDNSDEDRETIEITAAVWNDIPLSPDTAYVYAREEGVDVTFVPQNDNGKSGAFVSVNPKSPKVNDISLVELGEIYEELEQLIENKEFRNSGEYRRDYSRPRAANCEDSIFLKRPFRMTSDPWYVSESGDVVAAPRGGTQIGIDRLIETFMHYTCMIKSTCVYYINLDVSQPSELRRLSVDRMKTKTGKESMLDWIQRIPDNIIPNEPNKYKVIVAEIDSSLIAHDFNILDAYYSSLINENISDIGNEDKLRIDYRTHLYVNQAFAVLFVATCEEKIQNDYLVSSTFENNSIIDAFCKILYQREKYKDIGRFIGTRNKKSSDIHAYSEELVTVLSAAQAYECIDQQIDLDIYNFIYNRMNMTVLRDNVTESMNRVAENKKDSFFRNIDRLSIISVPFILASTVFQMGMFAFEPLIDTSKGASISPFVPWAVYLIMMLGITLVYIFGGKRK